MAFPSGKFYQRMAIDGVTKDWDLADLCESDKAGRERFNTIANYKIDDSPISYSAIPDSIYTITKISTTFYDNSKPIIIPKAGTFPSIYHPSDIPRFVFSRSFTGPISGESSVYNFRKTDNSWIISGATNETIWANNFHGGILPDVVAILLQAAGGGGGSGAIIYPGGSTTTYGGSGGGSGASACFVVSNNVFSISLGSPGASDNDANDSVVYATDDQSYYFRCGGGKAGSVATYTGSVISQPVGSGGVFTSNGWINNFGKSYDGVSGGPAKTNGEAFPQGVYTLYADDRYGFSNLSVNGGVAGSGNVSGAGGGGGSSFLSVGGDGGDSTATSSPPAPQSGAGGGGGNAAGIKVYGGARGGVASAIVYFGYYAGY